MSLVKKAPALTEHRRGWLGKRGGGRRAASSVSRGNLRQQSVRQTKARRARGWDWETPAVPPSSSSSRLRLLLLLRRDSTRLDSTLARSYTHAKT